MTLQEIHMQMVDAVNNSKTQREHREADLMLHGWRKGVTDCGYHVDLIGADLAQFERGFENRPMCCGVFNDWKEAA